MATVPNVASAIRELDQHRQDKESSDKDESIRGQAANFCVFGI